MSLIINGVEIPTTNGQVLYNGTDLTSVVCNGVEVWKKIVFTSKEFSFTGAVEAWECPGNGVYKLEVWGAQGSSSGPLDGGRGGYCWGNVTLTTGDILYICVGGANTFNGGGIGGENSSFGGGATHIAKNVNRGTLKNYKNYQSEILIVGGGGGSSDYEDWELGRDGRGGAGGGLVGDNGSDVRGSNPYAANTAGCNPGGGGSQTSPGRSNYEPVGPTGADFGQGAPSAILSSLIGGLGGGGWYGGGAGSGNNGCHGGGGGSSYYGSLVSAGTTSGVNSGNGKAKITFVG